MQYHDFHLTGYTVSDFGRTISLHLVYDYAGQPKRESIIGFVDVAAYRFIHTGGAIITDIREESLASLLTKEGSEMTENWRMHGGYSHWHDDVNIYRAKLEAEGYRAWLIESAIGFEGFVVAKSVGQQG